MRGGGVHIDVAIRQDGAHGGELIWWFMLCRGCSVRLVAVISVQMFNCRVPRTLAQCFLRSHGPGGRNSHEAFRHGACQGIGPRHRAAATSSCTFNNTTDRPTRTASRPHLRHPHYTSTPRIVENPHPVAPPQL